MLWRMDFVCTGLLTLSWRALMDGMVPAPAAIAAQPPEMLMEKQTKGHVREMMMVNGEW